ncbi:DUF4256 domain-containing protein [Shouchella sp. JSM 1781072]|uniref:DUF4256 domain-containing protein n=1 Tax=Shouchella sp. JSM 1781072 TaxID=3344581 RepID=UPI0035C12FB5
MQNELSVSETEEILNRLEERFHDNKNRHEGIEWEGVQSTLRSQPSKLWSVNEMEKTGGEPDIVLVDPEQNKYMFIDCSKETPAGRRSTCYDLEALESRKKNKPSHNAVEMAAAMGVTLLTEQQYRTLQQYGEFDLKTSSWIQTPMAIRERGGTLFCDYRYGHTFVYHNGASSYYSARGFRAALTIEV